MSTTNNQSIQQINTAALRGTREAHQPDDFKSNRKGEMKMEKQEANINIRLIKNQFRGDYEILDDQMRCD